MEIYINIGLCPIKQNNKTTIKYEIDILTHELKKKTTNKTHIYTNIRTRMTTQQQQQKARARKQIHTHTHEHRNQDP